MRDVVSASAGTSNFLVLRNNHGAFEAPLVFPTGGINTRFVIAKDVNHDGKPNVIMGSEGSKSVTVSLNTTQ